MNTQSLVFNQHRSHGKGHRAERKLVARTATLKELGSKDSLKQLATSLVSAGVLSGINQIEFGEGANAFKLGEVKVTDGFAANVGKNLVSGLARASIHSAITGTDLETSIKTEVVASVLNAASAQGANWIGDQAQLGQINEFGRAFAHAVAGCAAGAAGASAAGSHTSSGSGCGAGALGAVVGELSAQLYGTDNPAKTIAFASMMSGIAAAAAGQDAQGVAIAAATGANAAETNRQLHPGERKLAQELARKSRGRYTVEEIENAMRNAISSVYREDITAGMIVNTGNWQAEIYDTGAQFQAGATNTTLVQVLPNGGDVDPALAAFIQTNTSTGRGPAYDWSNSQLGNMALPPHQPLGNSRTPAANGCVTAECAAGTLPLRGPLRDGGDVRNDVATGADLLSRGAGVVGSAATMAAVVPGPHQPGAASVALGATGMGLAADALGQVAQPDVGTATQAFFLTYAQYRVDEKLPLVAPVTNEVVHLWRQSNTSQSIELWVNQQWSKALDQLGMSK